MQSRRATPVLLVVAVLCGCTVVKPVTCAVVHPIRGVVALFEESSSEPGEVDDTPTVVALIEFPFVLPVFFVYKSIVGAIGGLATGVVSDFNVVSGHASWDKTFENVTRPDKTNAAR
jgi:hypothetical protein